MDSNRKPQIRTEALVAIVAACGFAFALVTSFATGDARRIAVPPASDSSSAPSAAASDLQPAVVEPALRTLQGVVEHG